MKIAVIAASGRSGKAFVKAALEAGHTVRAGVFGEHDFIKTDTLEVVSCDARDIGDITNLISNCDAVVSLIGHTQKSDADVQSHATRNCIAAMKQTSTKRFITLTGTGVRFPGDTPNVIDRVLNMAIRIIDPDRVTDGVKHVALLKQSELEWTVLRVLKLTNGEFTGRVKLSLTGPAEPTTPRAKVAQALLVVLQSDEYIKQAPIVVK